MSSITAPVTKYEGIAENYCNTKLVVKKGSFSWTIDCYSILSQKKSEKFKSSTFSVVGDNYFKWFLEHSMVLNGYSHTYSVYFDLYPYSLENLEKCGGAVTGNTEISVMKPFDGSKLFTKKSTFNITAANVSKSATLSRFEATLSQMKEWTFDDKLTIFCSLNYCKNNEIVTTSSHSPHLDGISESSLSRDLERCYLDDYFSDVTISVKDKDYPAHKTILATRSSVFNTMFRNNMQESQKNHIVITDTEQETVEEMLYYIYTGKTKNLDESAFELLPVADKYDLKELKIMCEEVLFKKLSVDNAGKILILADMHGAEALRTHTLRFIKENYAECVDFKNPDVWTMLTTSLVQLIKDMMSAFCEK